MKVVLRFFTKYSMHIFSVILLLIMQILVHNVWFLPNAVVSNGDWFYLFPEALKTARAESWISSMPSGTPFGGSNVLPIRLYQNFFGQLVALMGGNEQIANMFLFYIPTAIIGPIAIYTLLYRFSKNNIASFVGSVFYFFNSFILVSSAGGYPFVLTYAFIPLVFLLFDTLLVKFSYKKVLIFLLLTAFLNMIALHLMIIVYIIFIAYFIFQKKTKINDILHEVSHYWKRLMVIAFVFLTTNFYIFYIALSESFRLAVSTGITSRALIIPGYLFFDNALTTFHPFWTGKQPTLFYQQPVMWYFWIIPLYTFLGIFFIKKNKLIGFFLGVSAVMVFLGKGPTDPFGFIYEFLYDHFPLFNIYREASKFWIGILLCYAVLIALSIVCVFDFIKKHTSKTKNVVFKSLFIAPLLVVLFCIARPAVTGELGPGYISYPMPQAYKNIKEFIYQQKEYFRVLQVPTFSPMIFFSEEHPRLTYNDLPEYLQFLSSDMLRFFAVKYIIVPDDPYYNVFPGNSPKQTYISGVDKTAGLKKINVTGQGNINVYQDMSMSVPHIYPVADIDIINGKIEKVEDANNLRFDKSRDFYWDQGDIEGNKTQELKKTDLVSGQIKSLSCLTCTLPQSTVSAIFKPVTITNESQYRFFIKNVNIKNVSLLINKEKIPLIKKEALYFSDEIDLRKETYTVSIEYQKNNLISQQKKVYSFDLLNKSKEYIIRQNNLADSTPYTLSFFYFIPKNALVNFKLNQSTDFYFQYQQNSPGGKPWKAYNGPLTNDGQWHPFSMTFTTLFNPQYADMVFDTKGWRGNKNFFIKNISLTSNESPEVFITKVPLSMTKQESLPKIIFQQVNPTKYVISVKDAKRPYFLIFSESYNSLWQLRKKNNTYIFPAAKYITSFPNVYEAPQKNSYELLSAFTQKNSHLLKTHFESDGYGNGWYVPLTGTYQMELTYQPQKDFMRGIDVSLFSFIILSFIVIIPNIKDTILWFKR